MSSRALDTFSIRYGISDSGSTIESSGINLGSLVTQLGGSNTSFGGSNISFNRKGDALGQLASINQELIRRKQHFTNFDPGIRALTRGRCTSSIH